MTAIPFLLQTNPQAGYLARKAEIDEAIHRALDSGWYILGKETAAFEEEFARYIGAGHTIGVANGTDALDVALRACGVGQGDAVITVSQTAVATVAAIELAGARPILVDIDPETFTMDPACLREAIEEYDADPKQAAGRLKAVIVVHLYGHPADMPAILEIARARGLRVIEDCAQSHGAMLAGKRTGTWGDIAAFSFYPTKNLGALGDGGAVVTSDPALAEQARLIREYGWRDRYVSAIAGMNSRLDELQSALLRVKLRYLDEENARRGEIAVIYNRQLQGMGLTLPLVKDGATHVYHQYVIRTSAEKREPLRAYLKDQGIGALVHYPLAVHEQPAYRDVRRGRRGLPVTETIRREILSLPMYPQLTSEQIARVCDGVRAFCAS